AVRAGRDRARDRLAIDVAHRGHRDAGAAQRLAEREDARAGPHRRPAARVVDRDHAPQVLERDDGAAVGGAERNEGMTAASDAHGLAALRALRDHRLELVLARWAHDAARARGDA